jgi:DNA polymerase I
MTSPVAAKKPHNRVAALPAEWKELRKAVREAQQLGAGFRIVGDTVEISGVLPDDVRDRLDPALLREYLGAAQVEAEAIAFLDTLDVKAVTVENIDGADLVMGELSNEPFLGLDIETGPPNADPPPVRITKTGLPAVRQPKGGMEGLDPHRSEIMALQIYGGTTHCFVFRGPAIQYVINSDWFREQYFVAHNASFEEAFLQKHCAPTEGGETWKGLQCTMQAAGLLHGVWNRSLAAVSEEVLGRKPPKDLQTSTWSAPILSAGQIAYAASDAVLAYDLWKVLVPELRRTKRSKAYVLQRNAIPAVADMQLRGLGFDPEVHAEQVRAWSTELAESRRAYLEMTGDPPPSKPAEVLRWLQETAPELMETWPRTEKGGISTEAKHLKRLVLLDKPSAKLVLSILAMQKLISTYGVKFAASINPVTGRFHTSYKLAGAKSGRFSASEPNLQNLPSRRAPEFRQAIVAKPGYVLVGGDWSQIELRGAAWISKDENMTAVFREGRDLHTETASAIAGVPVELVSKAQRAAAKAVNFGSIYGIGARSLAMNALADYGIEMTEDEAQEALDRFFARFSGVKRWMDRTANRAQASHRVVIGVGRVVEAEWEPSGFLSRQQCCNLPIQGAAADAMLRALALVHQRLRGIRGGLVASVHDEILLEVAEADAEAARQILAEVMVEAFEVTFTGAPTQKLVDLHIGRTWKDVK